MGLNIGFTWIDTPPRTDWLLKNLNARDWGFQGRINGIWFRKKSDAMWFWIIWQ